MRTIGTRIREAREAKGLTRSELAKLAGPVSHVAVSQWEADQTRPRDARLEKIAAVLDVDYNWLRAASGTPPPLSPSKPPPIEAPEPIVMTVDADLLRKVIADAFSFDLQALGADKFSEALVNAYRRTYSTRHNRKSSIP
jgi:transcriptional regulator with XRE-family HTH domain